MAARIRKIRHDENTREKIRVAMLRRRLEGLVEGKIDMPPHAVTAALGLLRKRLPDLAQTTLEGGDKPITQRTIITGVERATDLTQLPISNTEQLDSEDDPGLAARH